LRRPAAADAADADDADDADASIVSQRAPP
jgi:hypothetical protein